MDGTQSCIKTRLQQFPLTATLILYKDFWLRLSLEKASNLNVSHGPVATTVQLSHIKGYCEGEDVYVSLLYGLIDSKTKSGPAPLQGMGSSIRK